MIHLFIFLVIASCTTLTNTHSNSTINGKVIYITDGDTLTIETSDKKRIIIRLAFIDAPEYDQNFGDKSKQYLKSLAYKQNISIISHNIDKWGRIIGTVYIKGKDINYMMVESGLAWHYKKYTAFQTQTDKSNYSRSEELAKQLKKGLWSSSKQIAPWLWRQTRR